MKDFLSLVAGVLFVIAFFPYGKAILSTKKLPSGHPDKVEPAKVSWIIWAVLDTLTLIGMWIKHAVNGQIIAAAFGAWVIVILAVKYGASKWTKLDKVCLCGAFTSIALMYVNPVFALVASLSATFVGAIPTFQSAWNNPAKEDKLAWTIFWVSCLIALCAVPQWTMADAGQPITFTLIETIIVLLLYIKVRPKRKMR
ncbi:MAG: hypothetical protein WC761_04930 [Candidatus Paceibacterota bacterium]|jgi:hypothetical protein